MIVDFDSDPRNSIVYTSSLILDYLKDENNSRDIHELCRYCLNLNMNYSILFLTIDWMYLLGIVREINDRNEVVLCD